MNFKALLIVSAFLCIAKSNAQERVFTAPDYNWIKEQTEKKDSKFNFKLQVNRLMDCDSTLTAEEYRNLYYGYFFQPGYKPYGGADENHKKLTKYYQSEKIDSGDYDKIIKLSDQVLKDDPFDLRVMNFLGYVYHLKGDDAMAKKTSMKFHGLLNAILSSGDGKACETGFHVLSVSHEYVLLNMFELQSESQSLVGNCDYLAFEKGKYKVDGLYFNITKMRQKQMESFEK